MTERAVAGTLTWHIYVPGVPLPTKPGNSLIILLQTHSDTYRHNFTTDIFLFISHTTNVLLFKSRCNIFIGFGIIEELPGLVGSGTFYIRKGIVRQVGYEQRLPLFFWTRQKFRKASLLVCSVKVCRGHCCAGPLYKQPNSRSHALTPTSTPKHKDVQRPATSPPPPPVYFNNPQFLDGAGIAQSI